MARGILHIRPIHLRRHRSIEIEDQEPIDLSVLKQPRPPAYVVHWNLLCGSPKFSITRGPEPGYLPTIGCGPLGRRIPRTSPLPRPTSDEGPHRIKRRAPRDERDPQDAEVAGGCGGRVALPRHRAGAPPRTALELPSGRLGRRSKRYVSASNALPARKTRWTGGGTTGSRVRP